MEEVIREKTHGKRRSFSKKKMKSFYLFIRDNDLRQLVHLILSRLMDKK